MKDKNVCTWNEFKKTKLYMGTIDGKTHVLRSDMPFWFQKVKHNSKMEYQNGVWHVRSIS